MESNKLKQKLETFSCHIHGDSAIVTLAADSGIEIETCCLLFRHQLLLIAGKEEKLIEELVATA